VKFARKGVKVIMITLILSIGMAVPEVSPKGVAAAQGVLYLLAVLAIWALVACLRQAYRVVAILLRILLVVAAVLALGAAAVAIIAQVALSIGLS
jgi:hypothetical protein